MSGMGVLVTSSGERYEGEFLSGQKSGQGTLTRADGLVISGTFSMGVCVKGIVAYQDGSVYNGPLHKGSVRHGIGVMRWRTGDVYEGSFVDDQLSGQGVLKSANGDRYDGNWQNNLENGEGTMEYANGNRYKGEWRNGKRHGRGEFYYMSGNIFKGEYADGFANGKGMFLYKDGSRFTGMFRAGKKEGNGTFVFADGRTLEGGCRRFQFLPPVGITHLPPGTWVDDQMQGPGVMTYMNGDKYIGEWQNYKWHGNGEFIFENGCRYIAVFENGAFPATGTLVYPNGNRWQGRVDRRGRRQDAGVMTWTNGESFRGAFVDDKRHGEVRSLRPGRSSLLSVAPGHYDGRRWHPERRHLRHGPNRDAAERERESAAGCAVDSGRRCRRIAIQVVIVVRPQETIQGAERRRLQRPERGANHRADATVDDVDAVAVIDDRRSWQ